ncbi:MAG: sulfotransferase, partial [Gemmatimonadetes bacterium]|nr:sulfotransferase [Gemmatimonadota bacterium]
LNQSAWKRLDWDEAQQRESIDVLIDQSWYNYRHPLEVLEAHPDVRSTILEYDDLTTNPADAIEAVYRELDLPMSEAFRKKLSEQSPREKKHKTRFKYSLEEFGIESDSIRSQLGDLFERFGWDDATEEKKTASERGA